MLEPAAFGVPTLFGPGTRNFAEIAAGLLSAGGAVEVTAETLADTVRRVLTEPETAAALSAAASQFASSHTGAAARTADLLLDLLPMVSDRPDPQPVAE